MCVYVCFVTYIITHLRTVMLGLLSAPLEHQHSQGRKSRILKTFSELWPPKAISWGIRRRFHSARSMSESLRFAFTVSSWAKLWLLSPPSVRVRALCHPVTWSRMCPSAVCQGWCGQPAGAGWATHQQEGKSRSSGLLPTLPDAAGRGHGWPSGQQRS